MALSKGAKGAILIGLLGKRRESAKVEPSEDEDREEGRVSAARNVLAAIKADDPKRFASALEAAVEMVRDREE